MTRALNTCMILAAGFGKRLLPFTNDIPKPLVEVLGKPLLDYHLDAVYAAGIRNVLINAHHHADQIFHHVQAHAHKLAITVSCEDTILGTGGGIKKMHHLLHSLEGGGDDPLLVIQGDIFIDMDMEDFYRFHKLRKGIASLVLKEVDDFQGYGAVGDLNDRILKIADWVNYQGPPLRERFFCGVHMLSHTIFDSFPKRENFCLTSELYPQLIRNNIPIYGYSYDSLYCDVGTPYRLWKLNMDLLAGAMRPGHYDPFARFEKKGENVFFAKNVRVAPTARILGPVILDDDAIVNDEARVGPNVVVGKKSIVDSGAYITNSVLLSGAQIVPGKAVHNAIVSLKQMEIVYERV